MKDDQEMYRPGKVIQNKRPVNCLLKHVDHNYLGYCINCRAGSEANNPNAMLFGLGGCGVCMYVTLLRSKCTISYMQRTRGLTENTWHAQKKTFKRSEEMSHQELTRLRVQRY